MTIFALLPVFNRLEMTRRMVSCLRAQSDAEVRIVVIDDGSTDSTWEWLESQRDIVSVRGEGTLWWAGAVDVALRKVMPTARGDDYVLLVNNDTVIEHDFVATLLRVSREYGGVPVGSALRDQAPPHAFLSIGPRIDIPRMRVWDLIDDLPAEERARPKAVYEVDALSGRGTLYPVPVLRATGYLRPHLLPHYHADYELAARARRKDFKTVVSTRAVVYTENSFGVHRAEKSLWSRLFDKGGPNNPLQRTAFWLLVGTPRQRAAALPRMLASRMRRVMVRLMPPRLSFAMNVCRVLLRVPLSGQARARVLMYLPLNRDASYNARHAYTAGTLVDVLGKQVLVVGCNQGNDCAYFVRLGARAVHGLDVIPDIGSAYQHTKVRYLRASAERIPVRSGTYDLVFCFATMEHVPGIEKAFAEMARVTRADGLVYSVASPLWNSRYGHHKGDLFERFPWIHLRMTEREIVELCEREGIHDPTGKHPVATHVSYMLNPRYFNMVPARRYVAACNALHEIEVAENSLSSDSENVLLPELRRELEAKGYVREELLAVTHTFIGRKRPTTTA